METDSQKIEKAIAEVASENLLQQRTVRDIYEKLWQSVRYFMSLDEMPKIIIRNFATIEPHLSLVEKQIKKIKDKGSEGKEERLEVLNKVKERLINEGRTRRHSTRVSREIPDATSDCPNVQRLQCEISDSSRRLKGRDQENQEAR